MAKRLTIEQVRAAVKTGADNGHVIIPTQRKFPKGIRGWQKFTESYYDGQWEYATGWGIVAGASSNITVIDVDDDMEWFRKFWAKYDLQDTTRVCTPSGGLHLYFLHDARLKQTQGFNGLSIDVRNDGGYIMAPGSPYDVDPKKTEKVPFIGKCYTFDVDDDGKPLDFSRIRKLDEIFIKMQLYGMSKETFELLPEKAPKKQKIVRDVTNGRQVITNRDFFLEYVMAVGKQIGSKGPWYEKWVLMVWSICKVANDNRWDAEKLVLEFSRGLPGYNGDSYALAKVREFNLEKAKECSMGLPLLLSEKFVKRGDPARARFLKNFRREYFFNDYVDILSEATQNDGVVALNVVHDFLSTALIKVLRAGTPSWYLREEVSGTVVWKVYGQQANPFKGDNCGPFDWHRPKTPEELEKSPEPTYAVESSSFKDQLLRHQYSKVETYSDIVFRPYWGETAPCSDRVFNSFQGYRHTPFSDDVAQRVYKNDEWKFMMNHWLETMCDGNEEMFEYAMNWSAYLLKYGYRKLRTFLVFIGAQRIGKNMMWEKLFIDGVIGAQYGKVVDSLSGFQTNFNSLRLNTVFTLFNECTAINMATRSRATNWDRIKALVDIKFRCEYKGKEAFIAEDPSAYVFCSNHEHSIWMDDNDHRFVITSMDAKHQGDTEYFNRLFACVTNPKLQRAFFTFLVNRDLEHWDMADFPKTALRMKMIENKSHNVIFKYFVHVVTERDFKWGKWYMPEFDDSESDAWPKCFYAIDGPCDFRMFKQFQQWADHMGVKKTCNRFHFKSKMVSAGIVEKRVTDRSFGATGKQVMCLKITKNIIRELMRKVTNDAAWEFDEGDEDEPS